MEWNEFVKRQDSIYTELRDTSKVREGGLIPNIKPRQGGYVVAFRHPEEITNRIYDFSSKIARQLGDAVIYGPENAHTTISDLNVSETFVLDMNIVSNLSSAVSTVRSRLRSPKIEYLEWLYSQDSLIAAGRTDETFLDNSKHIIEEAKKEGILLKYPKMSHITTSRFTQIIEPGKRLYDFFKLVEEEQKSPLGVSRPKSIDVACFTLEDNVLEFTTCDSFPLQV